MKVLLQKQNRNYFKKTHHYLFTNQSLELSSSEIDNIIQEEEEIKKKKPQ